MFVDMVQRTTREVPGCASSYAKTLINEALGLIYDSQLWSFQLQDGGWITPGLLFPGGPGVSVGTIAAAIGSNQLIGDATASAAWQAYITGGNVPLFNSLQIRSPYYSLYNIIQTDTSTNAPFTTLTLDRPWMEPGGSAQSYMIYQAYFVVPAADFRRFMNARDTTNNWPMDYWGKSQMDLAVEDAERTNFDDPGFFVPYQVDNRPGSSTPGQMMYELWPHPLSVLPYTFQYVRRGPLLVNPSDTVPYPLTEECVLWRTKECAYTYKEAQKGEDMERGKGANWQFLSEKAHVEYERTLKPLKMKDEDMVNLFVAKFRRDLYQDGDPYSTVTGQLNIGRM